MRTRDAYRTVLLALGVLVLAGAIVVARVSNLAGPRPALAGTTLPTITTVEGCEQSYTYDEDDTVSVEMLVVCWDQAGYLSVAAPGR